VTTVLDVRLSKARFQLLLLEQRNVDEIDNKEYERPLEVRPGQKHQCFTEEDEHDPGYHRIANEPIRPKNHEATRRIPRRESALSTTGKSPE
jgi:hypothetical protein